MFFDENVVLDVRLKLLNEYVDFFVIVESTFNHKGEQRNLKFDINKFKEFKHKIIYLTSDKLPKNLEPLLKNDSENKKELKYIFNAVKRENYQRNFISKGLKLADKNDIILISDLDEIPFLKNINIKNIKEKIIIFEQIMTYYKFNLGMPNFIWHGTKACKKKNLLSPQWLRNVKAKKYPLFRLDILLNKKKFNNVRFIKNGGWHFSNIKEAEEIEHKLKSYLHHREFELSSIDLNQIKKTIRDKRPIYDLTVDQRKDKIGSDIKLLKINDDELPNYIIKNKDKFANWLE